MLVQQTSFASVTLVQVASSAKEVAETCDIIVAMLADPAAARAVAGDVASGMTSGEHVVNTQPHFRSCCSLFWSTLDLWHA